MNRERRQNVSHPLNHSLPPVQSQDGYPEIEEAEIVDVSNLPANLRDVPEPPAAPGLGVEEVMAEIEADAQQRPVMPPASTIATPSPVEAAELEPPEDDMAIWEQAAATDGLEPPEDDFTNFDAPTEEDLALASEPSKKLVIRSRRASLTGPTFLPLLDKSDALNEDAFSHILSDMGSIQPGEHALVSFLMRPDPEYRQQAQQWVTATKAGDQIDKTPAALKGLGAFGKLIGFIFKLISFTIRRVFHEARGGEEAPRWNSKDPAPTNQTVAFQLDDLGKEGVKQAENKRRDNAHMQIALRVSAFSTVFEDEVPAVEASLEAVADNMASAFSALGTSHQAVAWSRADDEGIDALLGRFDGDEDFVLGNTEISSIVHIPDDTTWPHGVSVCRSGLKPVNPRRMPYRIRGNDLVPDNGLMTIGELTGAIDGESTIGMKVSDLDKHMVIFGKTGTGKSDLMTRQALGMVAANYPVVVNDVHGPLANAILNYICMYYPQRLKDVVLLDIKDEDFPAAINPLDVSDPSAIGEQVDSVMNMLATSENFTKGGSPRAEDYARRALTALAWANLKLPPEAKLGLLHIPLFFETADKGDGAEFRHLVTELCPLQDIKAYFDYDLGRFEQLNEATKIEHTGVVVRTFTSFREKVAVRRMFATTNKLDIPKLISNRSILLVKLARFGTSDDLSMMIARMILPQLLGSIEQWGRKEDEETGEITGIGCRLVIDEFGRASKASNGIASVLAEGRKKDFGVLMGLQNASQIEDPVMRDAVFANTFSKVSLTQDPKKTSGIEVSIGNQQQPISPEDLGELNPFEGYGNILTSDSQITGPFSFRTLQLPKLERGEVLKERRMQARHQSRALIASSAQEADARYGVGGELLYSSVKDALQEAVTKNHAEAVVDLPPAPVFEDEGGPEEFSWGN